MAFSRIRRVFQQGITGPGDTWNHLLEREANDWSEAKASASGPRVLVATSLGSYHHGTVLESTLAVALTLRGAKVDILLCDAALPACLLTKLTRIQPGTLVSRGQQRRVCAGCVRDGNEAYAPLGLPIRRYSETLSQDDAEKAHRITNAVAPGTVAAFKYDNLAVGEHAMAGALRYFGRADLRGEPRGDEVVSLFLEAAMRTVFSIRRLLNSQSYDVAVFHHGIYVPQGLIGEVCRQEGVRVVNSNPAYRDKTFIFSHGDTYHHTMISEPTTTWQDMRWDAETESRTMQYLERRRRGSDDWIHFNDEPEEELEAIKAETGISFTRPTFGMLTNVLWDAQLHYASNAFPSMLAWVQHSLEWFRRHPDLDLIIRVHPAETTGAIPSRQPLLAELTERVPHMPANVYVVRPESKISTYRVLEHCSAALIYNTKTGIELAAQGQPVVVAGEAWIRGKGFSLDATTIGEYDAILDTLATISPLSPRERELARRYAFHFFFRRMLPLPFVSSPRRFEIVLELESLKQLEPGASRGLDVICDGILNGSDFILQAELS